MPKRGTVRQCVKKPTTGLNRERGRYGESIIEWRRRRPVGGLPEGRTAPGMARGNAGWRQPPPPHRRGPRAALCSSGLPRGGPHRLQMSLATRGTQTPIPPGEALYEREGRRGRGSA